MNDHFQTLLELARAACLETEGAYTGDVPLVLLEWPTTSRSTLLQSNVLVMKVLSTMVERTANDLRSLQAKISSEPIPVIIKDALRTALQQAQVDRKERFSAASATSVFEISGIEACNALAHNGDENALGAVTRTGATLGDLFALENAITIEIESRWMAEYNACLTFVCGGQELPTDCVWKPDAVLESAEERAKIIAEQLYRHADSLLGTENISAVATLLVQARLFRSAVLRAYCEHVYPAQRDYTNKGTLRYLLTGSRYLPEHSMKVRVRIPAPAGYFNYLFKRYTFEGAVAAGNLLFSIGKRRSRE